MAAHEAAELKRHAISRGELQVGNAARGLGGECGGFGKTRPIKGREPQESGASARGNIIGRIVHAEKAIIIVFIKAHQRRKSPCRAGTPHERSDAYCCQATAAISSSRATPKCGRADAVRGQGRSSLFIESAITSGVKGEMTSNPLVADPGTGRRQLLPHQSDASQVGGPARTSVQPHRTPDGARCLHRFMEFFSGLDLSEANSSEFRSMHDCFTRRLKPGARPIDPTPDVLVSPCDGIIGAHGRICRDRTLSDQGQDLFAGRTPLRRGPRRFPPRRLLCDAAAHLGNVPPVSRAA